MASASGRPFLRVLPVDAAVSIAATIAGSFTVSRDVGDVAYQPLQTRQTGGPGHPDMYALWRVAERTRITSFGVSAPYILGCMKAEIEPGASLDLSAMRSIGSTGAPLPPEGFAWVYEHVKSDLLLASISGGTDIFTAFVGGGAAGSGRPRDPLA